MTFQHDPMSPDFGRYPAPNYDYAMQHEAKNLPLCRLHLWVGGLVLVASALHYLFTSAAPLVAVLSK